LVDLPGSPHSLCCASNGNIQPFILGPDVLFKYASNVAVLPAVTVKVLSPKFIGVLALVALLTTVIFLDAPATVIAKYSWILFKLEYTRNFPVLGNVKVFACGVTTFVPGITGSRVVGATMLGSGVGITGAFALGLGVVLTLGVGALMDC
jgi:hypothetical protein